MHEIIACRSLISEIGKQRVRSNIALKKLNKDADEREADLVRRLARINLDEPKDMDSAASKFTAREQYFSKLTKTCVERLQMTADVHRQNIEIDSAETVLKERIALLEQRSPISRPTTDYQRFRYRRCPEPGPRVILAGGMKQRHQACSEHVFQVRI